MDNFCITHSHMFVYILITTIIFTITYVSGEKGKNRQYVSNQHREQN